jgi:fibronectin-binding autotransporter adhesin
VAGQARRCGEEILIVSNRLTTPAPGTSATHPPDHDQLNATGTVNLNGATLTIASIDLANTTNGTFIIVQSATSVVGTVAGLADGASFSSGGATFTITYNSKSVVVLTRTA